MEIAIACASLCIAMIVAAAILARSATNVVKELSKQQVWLWNRLLALIEPRLQERVDEMVEAEETAQQLEDDQDLSKILKPKESPEPFKY